MANTYSWDCKTVDAWVKLDDNSDVVYNIHYICTITSDNLIFSLKVLRQNISGKITEWCQDSLGEVQVQNIKDGLKSRLDDLITPKSVTLTLDS